MTPHATVYVQVGFTAGLACGVLLMAGLFGLWWVADHAIDWLAEAARRRVLRGKEAP